MTPKPRIALIASRVRHQTRADTCEIPRAYLDAVLRAGGRPCRRLACLPADLSLSAGTRRMRRLRRVMHPARYGQPERPETHAIDPERDALSWRWFRSRWRGIYPAGNLPGRRF